jgi:alpha-glucosidase
MAWWRDAVFYEIYIRSFQDSNDDGIGDLNGITSRLGYLADLGVTALWITPFYPSPQVDFGYDVSDHEDVDPQFGTLADFDRLVHAAHARGMHVVIDVVLNHTSDRHAWFESSRASRTSPLRDWYVWRDGAADGEPPNNWQSTFGGPAWTRDAATGQWYYHCFYREQPDLNWRNPAVEQRMLETLKFWLDRGVDGFRLDAVNTLFEDPDLRDNPMLETPRVTLTGVVTQSYLYTRRLPELHDALRRVRAFVDAHASNAVLISEAYVEDANELARFYGAGDEMHLPFNFFLAQVPTLDAGRLRRAVADGDGASDGCWPSVVLSNHDIDRACDRYAGAADAEAVGKLLAVLMLTLRGTPFLYYGEEIGMRTDPPARLEDVRDPVGRTFWPNYKGRDGVRRPMPWQAGAGAGFTNGQPWLPLSSDADERNVARQLGQAGSTLEFYRGALAVRRQHAALREGTYEPIGSAANVFAFKRSAGAESVLVVLNMSAEACSAALASVEHAGAGRDWRVLIGTHRCQSNVVVDTQGLTLAPFESVVLGRATADERD